MRRPGALVWLIGVVACESYVAGSGATVGDVTPDASVDGSAPSTARCPSFEPLSNPACLDDALGVFVRAGSAGGDGTRARPFGSIREALEAVGDRQGIFVASGTYAEAVRIEGRARVLVGGLREDLSAVTDTPSVIEAPTGPALTVTAVEAGVRVDGFVLRVAAASTDRSRIALLLHDSGALGSPSYFSRSTVQAPAGLDAPNDAKPGDQGTGCGLAADGGDPGACSCEGIDVGGGAGGNRQTSAARGKPVGLGGAAASAQCRPGGDGTEGADPTLSSSDGVEGRVGADGTWTLLRAGSGPNGRPGGGGGGGAPGGGGGASQGGGGGAGGCGGFGGQGGAAGGSSIAALVSNSYVQFAGVRFVVGDGGRGGEPAPGGAGQPGGAGGPGRTDAPGSCDAAQEFGAGGKGGDGGLGATGLPGPGGIAAGVVQWNGVIELRDATFEVGQGGAYAAMASQRASAGPQLVAETDGTLRSVVVADGGADAR